MKTFVLSAFIALAGVGVMTIPAAQAQVSVNIGVAPECPYGYYAVPPYNCAPAGYYGPEWFTDGVFIGAGPWYHAHRHFHGHVDNHFALDHGYRGPFPQRGEAARPEMRANGSNFHGNEMRDERGHRVGR